MQAYIFVNTEPGKLWEVAENALKIEGVRMAHAVTGQYDVIIYAEFVSIDMLEKLNRRSQGEIELTFQL